MPPSKYADEADEYLQRMYLGDEGGDLPEIKPKNMVLFTAAMSLYCEIPCVVSEEAQDIFETMVSTGGREVRQVVKDYLTHTPPTVFEHPRNPLRDSVVFPEISAEAFIGVLRLGFPRPVLVSLNFIAQPRIQALQDAGVRDMLARQIFRDSFVDLCMSLSISNMVNPARTISFRVNNDLSRFLDMISPRRKSYYEILPGNIRVAEALAVLNAILSDAHFIENHPDHFVKA